METKTDTKGQIAILGAGALGVMYGSMMTEKLGRDRVFFLAEEERIDRYKAEGIYCNGQKTDFSFYSPKQLKKAPDLILISVKFYQLEEALKTAALAADEHTIFVSVLNGISSEELLIERFGKEQVLYCCVQGMDAVKEKNHFTYTKTGYMSIGNPDQSQDAKLKFVARLLDEAGIDYEIPDDIRHKMWSKLMLNTGVNQAAAVFQVNYGGLQKDGLARTMMLEAMKETKRVAQYEDIDLTEEEITQWMEILDGLNPDGMPSMRQDMLAGRETELMLFAGFICKKGREYGVLTPVNDYFYDGIRLMEKNRGILSDDNWMEIDEKSWTEGEEDEKEKDF